MKIGNKKSKQIINNYFDVTDDWKFKFRAWDGSKFEYSDELTYIGLENKPNKFQLFHKLSVFFNPQRISVDLDDYIIHQYTGLLDINLKEVYEGDIVIADYKDGSGKRKFVVNLHKHFGYGWEYHSLETLKILGNVCETPELLN